MLHLSIITYVVCDCNQVNLMQPKLNTEEMTKANWHIRNISEETQRLVRTHAAYRNLSITEMLEIIISDWSEQNRLTLEKSNPKPGE